MARGQLLLPLLCALCTPAVAQYTVMFGCIVCEEGTQISSYYLHIINTMRGTVDSIGGTLRVLDTARHTDREQYLGNNLAGVDCLVVSVDLQGEVYSLAPRFPDVKFIVASANYIVDLPNVQGIGAREDQAGFLAGVLAGLHTVTGRVASLSGPSFSPLYRFRNGFAMGVRSVCKACVVDALFANDFQDNGGVGGRLAELFVTRGSDVLFGAAGLTGSMAIKRVAGWRGTWVIGVDTDEWVTTFNRDNTTQGPYVLGSAVKLTGVGIALSVEEAAAGNFKRGWKLLDVEVGGVALTPCHASCAAISSRTKLAQQSTLAELKAGTRSTGVNPDSGHMLLPGRVLPARYSALSDHFGDPTSVGAVPRTMRVNSRLFVLTDTFAEAVWYDTKSHAMDHIGARGALVGQRREGYAAVGAGGTGFLFGGRDPASGTLTNELWAVHLPCIFGDGLCGVDPEWVLQPQTGAKPTARTSASMASHGTQVFLYGGRAGVQLLQDLWVLNTTSRQWQQAPGGGYSAFDVSTTVWAPPNGEPLAIGGVTDTHFLFLYGGRSAQAILGNFMCYGLNTRQWGTVEVRGERPKARFGTCLAAFGERVLLSMGQEAEGKATDAWAYSPRQNTWAQVQSHDASANEGKKGCSDGAGAGGSSEWHTSDAGASDFGVGVVSCAAVTASAIDVTQAGALPPYATAMHELFMVHASPSTAAGGLGVQGHPSITCNETHDIILAPGGAFCQACDNDTVAVNGTCVACVSVPLGLQREERVLRRCPQQAADTSGSDLNIGLVVGVVVGGVILVALPLLWVSTRNYRRMRRVLNTNKVISELAASISLMDFEAVAYLDDIERPTPIQNSFIMIVHNLKTYKAYMPASLFVISDDDESDVEASNQGDAKSSVSCTSSRSRSRYSASIGRASVMENERVRVILQTKQFSIMYVNAIGFLSHTENRGQMLAKIVEELSMCVSTHCGVPDTFIGDRYIASFGAVRACNQHRSEACRAALAMREFQTVPGIRVQVGIDCGRALCGNAGSAGMKKFTFFGPIINGAFALCRLNKVLDTCLLVSHDVLHETEQHFEFKYMTSIVLNKRSPKKTPFIAFELRSQHEVAEEEWMYQLEQVESQQGELHCYNRACVSLSKEDWEEAQKHLRDTDTFTPLRNHIELQRPLPVTDSFPTDVVC